MLDQSFSADNFRKIFDIENRKGVYLEGVFFPDVEKLSQEVQSCIHEFRLHRKSKGEFDPDEFQEKEEEISVKLEDLKNKKETALRQELEKVSAEVTGKGFSLGIREIDFGAKKNVFVADSTASAFFALKQVQHNIRRLYKVKQGNRYQIVCQIRELLADQFPKYIIRTDISSFYESIPRGGLLKKLNDDPLLTLTSKKIIRKVLFEYGRITGSDRGLPRGIGISAYLAELYMREIDSFVRNYPGVLYYARYVDDIFVIYCPPPNTNTYLFRKGLVRIIQNFGLKRNRQKTSVFNVSKSIKYSIEYLGYKFTFGDGKVSLRMTSSKVAKYKTRIDLTFSAYAKKSKLSEKKARVVLEKRLRFLTGNTRLVNNKKSVVSGIFFSNSLLNELSDLEILDSYLALKITRIVSNRLKRRLSSCSFEDGFVKRRFHKFSVHDLTQIVEVWKHVS